MHNEKFRQAALSDKKDFLIDSHGRKVAFDDPRIVHIAAVDISRFTKKMSRNVYRAYGRKFRTIEKTSPEIMKQARKLCSGRECVPMTAITGAVLQDFNSCREKDEISIYLTLDRPGPCQYGAWPVVWETFGRRLNTENTIFGVWPDPSNRHMGLPLSQVQQLFKSYILGDFFVEAENTLKVLAHDKVTALDIFQDAFDEFSEAFTRIPIRKALKKWAEKVAKIPLKETLDKTPKVLIFGGLNLLFVHYPVTDYFIRQGIVPKVVDASEGMLWLMSESAMRCGLKRNLISPGKQLKFSSVLMGLGDEAVTSTEFKRALRDRTAMLLIDKIIRKYRKIMSSSGLMFDRHISFPDLASSGHPFASFNGFTETTVTTGRFLTAIKHDIYDGLVNLGSFNCQPAMNSQAIIKPLSNKSSIPYAAIDCEGPVLSANQKKLLEVLAVQAKRRREEKNSRE